MKDAIFYIKVPVDTKYITTDGKGRVVAWLGAMPVYDKPWYRWVSVDTVGTQVMKFSREDWYQPKITYVEHMVSYECALKISVKVPDCAKYITCSSFGNVRAWLTRPVYFGGSWATYTAEKPFDIYTIKEIPADIARVQIIELKD